MIDFFTLYYFCMFLIGVSVLAIFLAVFIDFLEYHPQKKTKKERKSWVETGTMILFFILIYFVIRFNLGIINNANISLKTTLLIIGTSVIVFGTYVNIKGRFILGKNWSNQIKIYKSHTLVQKWPYSLIRHPLYASLIWAFYGASLIYLNWVAFLLNTFLFLPMMNYRAKQEEELLGKQFKNYKAYIKNVGRFFPKIKNG